MQLFDCNVKEAKKKAKISKYQAWKIRNNYIKSTGHQKCKNCKFLVNKNCNGKHYYKCELLGKSSGPATDIRIGHVCMLHSYEVIE